MLTIPSGFIDGPVTNLQVCWMVTRRDGVVIRGTEHDRDVTITTGTYTGLYLCRAGITGSNIASSSDLSVDNLEVIGALGDPAIDTSTLFILDVTAADIEAGLLDNAEAATFLVNAAVPDLYQRVLRAGWIGNSTREAEGKFTTEMRGLTQALSQGIVKTYGIGCQWELGSTPSTLPPGLCRVDMTAHTFTDSVATVYSRREFSTSTFLGFTQTVGGTIEFTSGLNSGYKMEILAYVGSTITLYLPMPKDITGGDTFIFKRGCDKKRSTCIDVYDNVLNYGGWATFVPGDLEVLKVGKR